MQFGLLRAAAFVLSPIHLLYTLYNCNVVFWWKWSVFNVLWKACHSTKIFGRSSAELQYSFGPIGQNFGFGWTL